MRKIIKTTHPTQRARRPWKGLACLRDRLKAQHSEIQTIWRITGGMERQLGVASNAGTLCEQLQKAHAVIATPSIVMLEAMIAKRPLALLDFHNRPHYVPAAWTITCESHVDNVVEEVLSPSPVRTQHQTELLHDALFCSAPATPRMVQLLEILREASSERPIGELIAAFRDQYGSHPVTSALPRNANNDDKSEDLTRQIDELKQRLQVAERRLELFEHHPLLGPAMRVHRHVNRLLGRSDIPEG